MRTQIGFGELFALVRRTPSAIRERLADRKFRRLLQKTPRVELGSLAEDTLGRFAGRVRPLEKRLIEAPLSGRLCVYFDVLVDAMVEGGFAGVLASEQDAIAFVLESGGYRAVLDPAHAKISAGVDYIAEVALASPSLFSTRQREFLVRHGLASRRKFFITGVRFREAILEADEDVSVVGTGIREPDPDAPLDGYRGLGRTRLRLTGSAKHPLIISDDPRSL